ncbi:MAG TPA: MobF family relaxase, partial [Actinotalea sp.]|nr:MobF family relaxase [Actinotalea sp.]
MSMCVRYAGDSYTYLLDSVATDHGRAPAGVEASAMTRYYAAHGTPPGTWLGAGLAGLNDGAGLAVGSFVTPVQMERLFARAEDPATGRVLGRAPHAAGGGRPVAGFDCTFTASKSVSVLWALADHATREVIYAAHRRAITDVLALIERDVAKTRIGSQGIAQVDVAGVVAAAFDHWDSRAGDPNLHTHVVIANRAQGPDGRWRTLDSRAIHKAAVAMSERYDTLLADRLTAALGMEWGYRDRGPNRNPAHELIDVPQQLLETFSRRSQAIDEETDRLIDAYVATHGHRPEPATVIRLRQQATLATREAKEVHSLADLTDQWHARAAAALGEDPSVWAARVLAPAVPEVADPLPPDPGVVVDEVAEQVLAVLSVKRSTWTAWNVDAEASRALKHHRFDTPAERDATVAEVVAEVARRSVLLTPAEAAPVPAVFRRADGSSAFRHHRAERYTSQGLLDAENRLLAAGRDLNGPRIDSAALSAAPGLFPDQAAAVTAIATSGRVVDVLVGPAGSGKTRTLAALRQAWEAQHGEGAVVGLAPSAAATDVLAQSLGIGCENTAKWLVEHDAEGDRLARIERARVALHRADPAAARSIAAHLLRLEAEVEAWRFRPGQLVFLDEASLASTTALDRIAACAGEAGAKLLLVGDWAQLSAVDAGGAFGLLARDRGAGIPELGTARRFTHPWERAATTRLRVGDVAALDVYEAHDRIHGGDTDAVLDGAYTSWAHDETSGKTSLLIAGDVETVRALNHRARTDRAADGLVELDGTRLRDGLKAGVGDRVVT